MFRSAAAALVALTLAAPLEAQDARTIRVGQTLSGSLTSDAQHDFTIELGANRFVFGAVEQIDADAVVTILDPEGSTVSRWDGPERGAEYFQFTTEADGTYTVRITPFEGQEGPYSVTIEGADAVATNPEDRIDQVMTRFTGDDTPGAVIGVVREGEVAFSKAYGMASLEFGVPHEVDTPTNIGSVTKQFTGMAILLLQNDGSLTLDDDVRTHIPELPDFGQTVTLRNMLTHTTGYRELYNFLPMAGYSGEDDVSRQAAIEIVQRQPELQDAPNTLFNYNNTSFILLATIVERVSGQTFPDFMHERVFEPLGMHDTRVKYVQGEVIPRASRGYVPAENGGWRGVRDLGASGGAGGIYTTFADMTRWMANYRDATVGGRNAIEHLTTPNVLADGDTTTYALGLGVLDLRGLRVYTHTGGDVAHRTFFSYFPDLDGGVFISSNAANFDGTVAQTVTDLYFEQYMEPEEDEDDTEEAASEEEGGTMSAERLEALIGEWVIEGPNLVAEFFVEDGTLVAHPRGQGRIPMTATSANTVEAAALGVRIVFDFEDDGSVDSATFTQGGTTAPMTRVTAAPMTEEELGGLEGRYFSRELDQWVEITVATSEDDDADESPTLELHRFGLESLTLRHSTALTFNGPFPFAEVDFVREDNGSVTGFLAGNGRTKGVLFSKQ